MLGVRIMNIMKVKEVNGCYAVTGDFFGNAYRGGKLNGTIVLSETCEFYGRSGHVDTCLLYTSGAAGTAAAAHLHHLPG